MPCPDCGASLDLRADREHACDPERRLDFVLFQLRDEIDRFNAEFAAYLESATGRFEVWLAARARSGRKRGPPKEGRGRRPAG